MRFSLWCWSIALPLVLCTGSAMACVYPNSLRMINATFASVAQGSGQISPHHRAFLARHMSNLDPDAVSRLLQQDLNRRDAAAATIVLQTARMFADGRGTDLTEDARAANAHMLRAVDSACSGYDDAATGGDPAQGAEQGIGRNTGQGGQPITYREQVMRLSLTFTTYLVFLSFLLGFRRQWHARTRRRAGHTAHAAPPQSGRV